MKKKKVVNKEEVKDSTNKVEDKPELVKTKVERKSSGKQAVPDPYENPFGDGTCDNIRW